MVLSVEINSLYSSIFAIAVILIQHTAHQVFEFKTRPSVIFADERGEDGPCVLCKPIQQGIFFSLCVEIFLLKALYGPSTLLRTIVSCQASLYLKNDPGLYPSNQQPDSFIRILCFLPFLFKESGLGNIRTNCVLIIFQRKNYDTRYGLPCSPSYGVQFFPVNGRDDDPAGH